MPFIHEDFLLSTAAARRLYREYASDEPILDYHNHLSPTDIRKNRVFANLWEIWLEGDHYKWRAMRSNGIPERLITGDATPKEKFLAWAETVPQTLRNPLYHWTHLELRRYFGIEELLSPATAEAIWDQANAALADASLSVHGILAKFDVRALCTTDDPADPLDDHHAIAQSGLATRVFPCFRPDKALGIQGPTWNAWMDRLASTAGLAISSWSHFLDALKRRHDAFNDAGCRLSDHGLEAAYAAPATDAELAAIFENGRSGKPISDEDAQRFGAAVMLTVGRWNAARGWTMQLHVGAMRNNNSRLMRALGPDTGFDAIGDWPHARSLSRFLDALDSENALPRTILYNLNPGQNYVLGTLIGAFQDGTIPGKIQLGSGWWFLDQKEGIEWQLNALSNLGLLSRFVGMVTDSRSFLSFPRHEYFRRVLCNLLGAEMERGEIPGEFDLVGGLIRNVCFGNARQYLQLPE